MLSLATDSSFSFMRPFGPKLMKLESWPPSLSAVSHSLKCPLVILSLCTRVFQGHRLKKWSFNRKIDVQNHNQIFLHNFRVVFLSFKMKRNFGPLPETVFGECTVPKEENHSV